jgi:endonuclease/exonuclease/phosphatase family metal-dependent hydrolase
MQFLNELKSENKVKLKKQSTRITTRTGEVYIENFDSENGHQLEYVGQGARPAFLDEMAKIYSTLIGKKFNKETNRWEKIEEQNECQFYNLDKLKIITYNVWFSEKNRINRAQALFAILEEHDPDIICLQEVTLDFLKMLLNMNFIRTSYYVNDSTGSTIPSYGVLMLSKFPFETITIHNLASNMGRRYLKGRFLINDVMIDIGTVHLESMDNCQIRCNQLYEISNIMESSEQAIVMGDFNFTIKSYENDFLSQSTFIDSWYSTNGTNPDVSMTRRGLMIDRVMHRSKNGVLYPILLRRIGTVPIPLMRQFCPNNETLVDTTQIYPDEDYPSDHDGIYMEFGFDATNSISWSVKTNDSNANAFG